LKFSRDERDLNARSQIFFSPKRKLFFIICKGKLFFIICKGNSDTSKMRSLKENTTNSISVIVQQAAIDAAVDQLIWMTEGNNGRLPHQAMEEAIDGLRLLGINVDRNFINYRKRIKLKKQRPLIGTDVNVGINSSAQSEITIVTNNGSNSSTSCSLSCRGRPSGTTLIAKQKRMKLRSDCINEIATLYKSELISSRQRGLQNSRTNVGFLKSLVSSKWDEYGLTEFDDTKIEVSCETIRNRVKRNNNLCTWKRGPGSPLSDIEDLIVDICISMGKIRQPLTVGETIDLANSLIEGKEQQQKLVLWKMRSNPDLPLEAMGRIGYGWFQGFKKRHGSRLVTKRGERFATDRADWSKYTYIKQMYDVIYDNMVESGIAEEILEDPISMDGRGNIVEKDDPQKLGLPCDIKVLYPEFILFADETGCNTNQKKDGHIGGTKYVVGRNTVPKEISSTSDKHFTVLGVTAASGDPVLCVVIFASERDVIPESWVTGIDIQKNPLMEETDSTKVALDSGNFGKNKYFPGGPLCNFLGKEIPCLSLCSPSGGITADLLISILKYIDNLNVFNRQEGGPTPLLIVDGHESRLDTSFLEYINDSTHKWFVSLGVPYATSYWQVGDASEQNGQFKMEMTRAKRILTSFKSDKSMKIGINYTDVMPLINKSWDKSFGCIPTNQKAIADRGWFPPNRNLLLHPDIVEQIIDDTGTRSDMNPTNLNVLDGKAGSCFDRILKYRSRNDGISRQRENINHGKSITEALESGRRCQRSSFSK
jgi:hypothetical protein